MAIVLSKQFMRSISQNVNDNMTGISLWTLEDVQKAQEKQRAMVAEAEAELTRLRAAEQARLAAAAAAEEDDDDDDFEDNWFSDGDLAAVDISGMARA